MGILLFMDYSTISIDSQCMTSTFLYMYVILILGINFCFSKICRFQIQFVNFCRSIQMSVNMLQTFPSFYRKISERGLFISANTYEKYIVCTDYCIAHHDDKTCFHPLVTIILYYLDTFKSY